MVWLTLISTHVRCTAIKIFNLYFMSMSSTLNKELKKKTNYYLKTTKMKFKLAIGVINESLEHTAPSEQK